MRTLSTSSLLHADTPDPGLTCGSPADRGVRARLDVARAKRIYRFDQHVVRTSRECEDAATEREEYERSGLVLLASEHSDTSWTRTLVECGATADEIEKWVRVGGISRAALNQAHQREMFAHSLEVTTARPLVLMSDPANVDLSSAGEAVPFFAITWPTVLPSFGPQAVESAAQRGEVLVSFGFGLFAIRHRILAHAADDALVYEICLDPKAVPVAGRNVVLTMHPVGTMALIVDRDSRIPRQGSGQLSLAVRATHMREGKEVSFEVGRLTSSFEYQAVSGSFDEDFVELHPSG